MQCGVCGNVYREPLSSVLTTELGDDDAIPCCEWCVRFVFGVSSGDDALAGDRDG